MRVSKVVTVRRLTTAATLAAAIWCGQAQAQVLEQVPSDAFAVFKIKDLAVTSAKVAKMAKTFGVDEFMPEIKDPLGAILEQAKMTKGINKDGDAAVVLYAPDEPKDTKAPEAGEEEPAAVALVPVSDYDAFVGNFEKADKPAAGEGVSAVKDPSGSKTLYVVHRGNYAVISNETKHLDAKGGIKLPAPAAREADTKDAVFFLNMPVIRERAIGEMKQHRQEIFDQMHKELAEQPDVKPYIPVIDAIVNQALDTAGEFLQDADAVVFSLNLTDSGIVSGALVDFTPDSKFAKTVADLKPASMPLLAGLPDEKYFFVGGSSLDHKAVAGIADEWLDPIIKALSDSDAGKKIGDTLKLAKTVMLTSDHSAVGVVVPTKPLGQDSLLQEITVVNGDAKTISGTQKQLLTNINDLMALAPQGKGPKSKIEFGEPRTLDGVELQTYSTKMEFDKNDPQQAQAQQILGMLAGPNGGVTNFGAADDKAFILTQGAGDELIKELIASAKSGKDVVGASAAVKATAAQLPADRSIVGYIYLDNIVTTTVKYAASFGFAVKIKLPENLPPIGIAAGAEGTSFRVDSVIPTDTVQALISAGLKAYTDMQQGGKGGGL